MNAVWFRRFTIGALAAFAVATACTRSHADPPPSCPPQTGLPGGFKVDGRLICDPGIGEDWYTTSSMCSGVLLSPPLTSPDLCGTSNPARQPAIFARDSIGSGPVADPTTFQGSNTNLDLIGAGQSPWSYGSGSPQLRDDISEVYVHARADINGDLWLLLGVASRTSLTDKHFDFEFNSAGVVLQPLTGKVVGNGPYGGRMIGDYSVSLDLNASSGSLCLQLREWNGQAWSPLTLPQGSWFTAASGAGTAVPCPVYAASSQYAAVSAYDSLQFLEAGLNVLATVQNPSECRATSTVLVKSRSSTDFYSPLRDFALIAIGPQANAGADTVTCEAPSSATLQTSDEIEGGPIIIHLRGSATNGACSWSVSSGNASIANPNLCETTAEVTSSATVRLTVDNDTCQPATDDVSIIVNPLPTCAVPNPSPLPVCNSAGNTLCATTTGAVTHTWSISSIDPGWAITAGQGTNCVTYTAGNGGSTAILGLTVTSGAGCSTSGGALLSTTCGTTAANTPTSEPSLGLVASPNPFRESTRLRLDVPLAGRVNVAIFNLLGQRVAVLADRDFTVGSHALRWNARNQAGEPVTPGVYYVRMTVSAGRVITRTRKVLLVR